MIAKRLHFVLLILAIMIILPRQLGAERLAVHTYTVADGLAGDQVTCIVQDRQGFLWIGTRTGLSRFDGVPMGSEARRHLFLILKEAIRNACRHGHPDNVTLRIERHASRLAITLVDDGVGFDPETPRDGQGLASMERRAAEMGAELAIDSTPGHGSTIHLDIPLTSHA